MCIHAHTNTHTYVRLMYVCVCVYDYIYTHTHIREEIGAHVSTRRVCMEVEGIARESTGVQRSCDSKGEACHVV